VLSQASTVVSPNNAEIAGIKVQIAQPKESNKKNLVDEK
jgi:hypothetical protein